MTEDELARVIYDALKADDPNAYIRALDLDIYPPEDADLGRTLIDGRFHMRAVARRVLDALRG